MMQDRLIMVPSDKGFHEILNGSLPVDFDGSQCVVARAGSGVLETVSFDEAIEYALGGEYDEFDEEWEETE
ncbi:hypothetical protein [Pseudanabaena sp. 'Roaring Creek']|uniref:hypothetical protein n=1 Tax=Pseudanabaena sp. 'Roaring Creek' TaxID=1681830 RepID=UPI0006D7A560|nr:hypothetical protein [Pseudanabaena sp. 'Roaring Creek']